MSIRLRLLVICCALASAWSAGRAAVTVYGDSPPYNTLINGQITDDSDPVGWGPVGPETGPGVLQGSGGPPHVVWTPVTARPLVVWAEDDVIGQEITFTEWKGTEWSVPEQLTWNFDHDVDPRLFVRADGTVYVVWWRNGTTQEVYLATRQAGLTTWDPAVRVSAMGESARRPSVAFAHDRVWVAYERDSTMSGKAQEVVVAYQRPNGTFERQPLVQTARTEDLDVMLHAETGKFWIDWKHAGDTFGSAEFEFPQWVGPESEPWVDPTWVGVEEVRKIIRQQVVE